MHAQTKPHVCGDPASLAAALAGAAPTGPIAAELTRLANGLGPARTVADAHPHPSGRTPAGRTIAPAWRLHELPQAKDASTDPARLTELATHPEPDVVYAVAENPSTPLAVVELLHQQLMATSPSAALCTIGRLGPGRWLTDALATGAVMSSKQVAALLTESARQPVSTADNARLVALADTHPDLKELRRQLGRAATMTVDVVLPDPAEPDPGHRVDFVNGLLSNEIAWIDQAADWFTAWSRTTDGALAGIRTDVPRRVLSDHQIAALTATPCPLTYLVLLSSVTPDEHVTGDVVAGVVATASPRLSTALLEQAPHRCTTAQLDAAIRIANLSNLPVRQVLEQPATADLPADTLLMLLERAAKHVWALWLAGKLPAKPTQALVDEAVGMSRFAPGNGIPHARKRRMVMAEQVGHELAVVSGSDPVPAVAMAVLEGLGPRLLGYAASAGADQSLYARTLAAWCARELGDDPHVWAAFVRLSGTVGVEDLDTLAMLATATLEAPARQSG